MLKITHLMKYFNLILLTTSFSASAETSPVIEIFQGGAIKAADVSFGAVTKTTTVTGQFPLCVRNSH